MESALLFHRRRSWLNLADIIPRPASMSWVLYMNQYPAKKPVQELTSPDQILHVILNHQDNPPKQKDDSRARTQLRLRPLVLHSPPSIHPTHFLLPIDKLDQLITNRPTKAKDVKEEIH